MRFGIFTLFALFSAAGLGELQLVSGGGAGPGCSATQVVETWRCGCRIEMTIVGGGVSSQPLMLGADFVIFSQSDKSNQECTGVFPPNTCPEALRGKTAYGKFACAKVAVQGNNITVK